MWGALAWVPEDEKELLDEDWGVGSPLGRENGMCKGPEVGMSLVWDLRPTERPGRLGQGERVGVWEGHGGPLAGFGCDLIWFWRASCCQEEAGLSLSPTASPESSSQAAPGSVSL